MSELDDRAAAIENAIELRERIAISLAATISALEGHDFDRALARAAVAAIPVLEARLEQDCKRFGVDFKSPTEGE